MSNSVPSGHPYIRNGVSETCPETITATSWPSALQESHINYMGLRLAFPVRFFQLDALNQSRLQRILEGICVATNSLYGHLLSPLVCS